MYNKNLMEAYSILTTEKMKIKQYYNFHDLFIQD